MMASLTKAVQGSRCGQLQVIGVLGTVFMDALQATNARTRHNIAKQMRTTSKLSTYDACFSLVSLKAGNSAEPVMQITCYVQNIMLRACNTQKEYRSGQNATSHIMLITTAKTN